MKNTVILFLMLTSQASFSAIIKMDVGFDVAFSQLAPYPGVDISPGDSVAFTLTYDNQATASVIEPTRAVYNILGTASVEIGSFLWTSDSFELEIWDNLDVLTPSDEITFRSRMNGPDQFAGQMSDVTFSFSSFSSDLTFTTSTSLPSSVAELNFSAVESSGFQLIQEFGTTPIWSVSGGDHNLFSLSTIPEPSTFLFLSYSFLGLLRRSRPKSR